jgi:hypothetical protein
MSRRRSIRPRNQREGPEQLPLVVPPKTRAGVEPEQAAKVAVARRAKPSALPDHVSSCSLLICAGPWPSG